jgi:small basic protein
MIDITWVQLIVAVVIPLVVGIITKEVTSPGIKAIVLAALAAVAGLATAYIDSNGVFSQQALQDAVTYFIVAVGSYYGLLKPTGVTAAVQQKTSNFGL